jgi:hypothetical protein
MTELTHEAVQQALAIADEVSPAPARAAAALKILRAEVHHRWEQRTALSFRLQDLRNQVQAAGLPDDSPLYLALHAATATAEAWMHPDTLSEAAREHLAWIKAELRDLQTGPLGAFMAERLRAMGEKGYTPEHDDEHADGSLAEAAACYAMHAGGIPHELCLQHWPWEPHTFKPGTPQRDMEKAGGLLIAEYQRRMRAEMRAGRTNG